MGFFDFDADELAKSAAEQQKKKYGRVLSPALMTKQERERLLTPEGALDLTRPPEGVQQTPTAPPVEELREEKFAEERSRLIKSKKYVPPEVTKAEEFSRFSKESARLTDEAKKQAQEALLEFIQYRSPGYRKEQAGISPRTLQRLSTVSPDKYADIVQDVIHEGLPGSGLQEKREEAYRLFLPRVSNAVRAFTAHQDTAPAGAATFTGVSPEVPIELQGSVEGLTEGIRAAEREAREAPTAREREIAARAVAELTAKLNDPRRWQERKPTDPTPGKGPDSVIGALGAMGTRLSALEKMLYAVVTGLEKNGVDLNVPGRPEVMIQSLINQYMPKEAKEEFLKKASAYRKLGGSVGAGVGGAIGEMAARGFEGQAGKAKEGETMADMSRREELVKLRKLDQEIMQTKDMSSWYNVILFVISSMVLGPNLTTFIFKMATDTGKLDIERRHLVARVAALKEQQKAEQERRIFGREAAIKAQLGLITGRAKAQVDYAQNFENARLRREEKARELAIAGIDKQTIEDAMDGIEELDKKIASVEKTQLVTPTDLVKARELAYEALSERRESIIERHRRYLGETNAPRR